MAPLDAAVAEQISDEVTTHVFEPEITISIADLANAESRVLRRIADDLNNKEAEATHYSHSSHYSTSMREQII